MPSPSKNESHKSYMERCVPQLIKEGKNPDQAVAVCSSMYSAKAESESDNMLEPEVTQSISFCGVLTPEGFRLVTVEDSDTVIEKLSFLDVFSPFNLEEGKTYEFEIKVEEP